MADDDALVSEVTAKLEALNARLPDLEGKANKRERTAVNKEIYALENDEAYAAAVKRRAEGGRAEAAADDAAHEEKLRKEKEDEERRLEAALKAQAEKAAAGPVVAEDDGEVHMEIKRLKKGDETTVAKDGDKVALTYTGTFAEGTVHEGVDYGKKLFDTTLQQAGKKGPKQHKPLSFVLGQGKAIRGWEECVRQMSLGEKLEVTIGPKWAYRKGGLQNDETGAWIVPPNATLVFEMRLVQVRDASVDAN